MAFTIPPSACGLYDPRFEHDACGVGFVADLKGRKSHDLLHKGTEILLNLRHRGASGCEPNTGDGAGILMQIPHELFAQACRDLGIKLPAPQEYAVGMAFLPVAKEARVQVERLVEEIVRELGQHFLGWRTVPVNSAPLGKTAKNAQPAIRQFFVGRGINADDDLAFERKLYVIRKQLEERWRPVPHPRPYIASLSCRTIVYKGMLTAEQLPIFYPDLMDPATKTALVLVHSRFSTNTFPSWSRAHPYRYIAHNGEINTLRGNVNWMYARQRLFASELFGPDIAKILPIIDADGSDSAMFDNALELLVLAGRSLPAAMMMMIPEPWTGDDSMSAAKRAFYEYHACLMEPWDGPASIAFTDGTRIGAVLDRNGLRPSRYYLTKDGLIVMASEVGVLDIPPERVLYKGRLQPGRMLLVDLKLGQIISDDTLKQNISTELPYRKWLDDNLVALEDLAAGAELPPLETEAIVRYQQAFSYTTEDIKILMTPMAAEGNEAIGSMGTDTPLAVLSGRPQLLYTYFKQLFAQVTNPPVDAIREELIMSIETTLGGEGNLLQPTPESARQIKLKSPILTNNELAKLRSLDGNLAGEFKSTTLPMVFSVNEGAAGLERALQDLCDRANAAVAGGTDILILSDRDICPDTAAIPALLAVSAVHHHLIREGTRTQVGLVVESGEPREVHHFALLIGYGAGAVNPYLAFATVDGLVRQGHVAGVVSSSLPSHDPPPQPSGTSGERANGACPATGQGAQGPSPARAIKNYIKAVEKGVVKIMTKMGISTIQGYRGAQVFEAVGLSRDVIDKYFTWTPSRLEGIGMEDIAREAQARHERAFPRRWRSGDLLDSGGQYQWRQDGEPHLFNPETVHKLQYACRTGNYQVFKQYSALVNNQAAHLCTLRGLFELKFADQPIPIDEVEPVEAIVQRFKSGAMSYGSISKEAHETLAIAMNRIGGKSNTGEGGEDPARYEPDANGDSRNSAIKQVASGRFGVTSEYLVMAKELQIKMAQGAKPGEGGQLPGHKVYPWIARVRHSTPGVGLISPPPHHDIYSIEDLAQLIYDLKNANHRARISVKLVAEVGVGTIAAGVAKAHADVVLISGHDGGTGASPLTSIKHAGVPWELGLAETHQVLVLNDLRSRIAVEVDGQLKTGRDVVIGALLGAEEFGFATAPLVALGCVMMRVCHLNTCPVGIATQDPRLRKTFAGDPEHVANFMRFIAQEVRELMAQLGFRSITEMVGRSERLETRRAIDHFKARGLDFSPIFYQPEVPAQVGRHCQKPQEHGLDRAFDNTTLLAICRPALDSKATVSATVPIRNYHRAVGTIIGSEVTRRYGREGLPEDTIRLRFQGSAGQSFGAFVPRGMTLRLEGDANDYLGKGLSGGKIIVRPPANSTFVPSENVIIGNVALYGATAGEAFIGGVAGERFAVRNSGAIAVVEAVGDHGCEYMTGGKVIVLGPTGRNFAAGMSGGIAYVLDEIGDFTRRCNHEMVRLFPVVEPDEIERLRWFIRRHAKYTASQLAWKTLALWDEMLPRFIKVYPNDYRRVLESQKRLQGSGLSDAEAEMAVFELNAQDVARAGGK
jgi:glutamate synthase (ferredoxin)